MIILAIDPGTRCGWAYWGVGDNMVCGASSIAADKGRRGLPAKPATRRREAIPATPVREPEPEWTRCGHLYELMTTIWRGANLLRQYAAATQDQYCVCEGAAGFIRGQAAVRVSNELRGVVKAWCTLHPVRYVQVEPGDLKRFATGRTNADKDEMIAAARLAYGYSGNDDNEADALHLLKWGRENLPKTNMVSQT